jgi:hypothetical protein
MPDPLTSESPRRGRGKIKTLSLDEQIEEFLAARGGLRLCDAVYGQKLFKQLPRRLADVFKTKRA